MQAPKTLRQALVQLPGSALVASLAALLAAEQLSAAAPPAAAAVGPRHLDPDSKAAVAAALSKIVTKQKAPVMLRLAYHDAATFSAAAGDGGPNASIQFELDRPENSGLKRGWKLIEQGTPAEGKLSNADLVALAGAHAVAVCGGPVMDVPVGRVDAAGPDPGCAGEAVSG
ncbi:heme peroxidase [Scenedesmus sp. NREL 46B-D3]|nr:heme peroxidase [Scenedesmus sp. NREL 46B-D3]